jgi:putative hydrolase
LYKLVADYHTHTRYSHGKGTILENVEAARKLGLKKIAIADHGFNHIGIGMNISDLAKIRQEITQLNQRYSDIDILMGIEANLISLDGDIDIPQEFLNAFDIILMGFHKAVKPATLQDAWSLFIKNGLDKLGLVNRETVRHANTKALINGIQRFPIRILTHPGAKINIDTRMLAKRAAKLGVALEINASHGFMTVEYVKIALEEGASFVISSDAHTPDRIGDFQRGIEIAKEAGVPSHKIINTIEAMELH